MMNDKASLSPAEALIPFTGYYALSIGNDSFVMVDTNSIWHGIDNLEYSATITISTDGDTSAKYPLGPNCTYNDGHLLITNPAGDTIASLYFSNELGTAEVSGTIGGVHVAGGTPFGPVPVKTWAGTYYQQGEPVTPIDPPQYPYTPILQVDLDGTVHFAANGGPLQPVATYWYDYGMFVIGLGPTSIFEMGTSSGWGRVAGNATDGGMLVNIRLQEPVPHL
jgi:hypothetical protein